MNDPLQLPQDKKERIIQAALSEFRAKGYEQASTNEITARARVSKGLIFHYFGSKEKLFLWLFDLCIERILKDYDASLRGFSPDLAERAIQSGLEKVRLYNRDPLSWGFLATALLDPPKGLKASMEERYLKLREFSTKRFLQGLDMSMLREGIDQQKVLEMLMIVIEGLSQKIQTQYGDNYQQAAQDAPKLMAELREYLDIFKYGAYQQD